MDYQASQVIVQLFLVVMQGSAPALLVSGVVGLVIAVLQGLTQINDQTLPQIAKLASVAFMLFVFGALSFSPLVRVTKANFDLIVEVGR